MNFEISQIIYVVGIPIGRSVLGWAENALEDKKITKFEWAQLGATVVRVGGMAVAGYLGLDALGIDYAGIISGASAFVLDFILSKLK